MPGEIADTEVSVDAMDVFEALATERRRLVLEYLHSESEGVWTLSGLATHIAAHENDIPIEQLAGKQRTRVHISLYQSHLPKLHTAGFIDYDDNRGTITPESWTEGLIPLIDELHRLDETREYEPDADAEVHEPGRNLFVRALSGVLSR